MSKVLILRELQPDLPVLFTHVPKTGGSAITSGMTALFGRDSIAGISTARPEKRRAFLEECRGAGKRYVYGHFRYNDAAAVYEKANLVVSLRHPLNRILSLYFMMLRNKHDFALECGKDVSGAGFLSFYEKFVTRRRQDNLLCRYLCGKPNYKRAIETLQASYCMAWDTDSATNAWNALRRGLGDSEPQSSSLRRRNHAPVATNVDDLAEGARPRNYHSFLPDAAIEMVADLNRHDIRLLEWFEKQVSATGTSVEAA